jgi:hypothetical protein
VTSGVLKSNLGVLGEIETETFGYNLGVLGCRLGLPSNSLGF